MSINKPMTTIVGNLTADPELRFTGSGDPVVKFRVLSTPRKLNRTTNEWEDGTPFGIDCTAWREMASHVAESLHRGDRVIVVGELEQRNYEDKEGNKRTAWDLQLDAVGPDLRYATTTVKKATKGGGAPKGDDEWANASKTRPAQEAAPAGPPANADQQRTAQQQAPATAANASPW